MRILVMNGDGIGSEITAATMAVVREVDRRRRLGLEFLAAPIGIEALKARNHSCPQATFDLAQSVDGIIMGPLDTYAYPPASEGGINPSARLRTGLDVEVCEA